MSLSFRPILFLASGLLVTEVRAAPPAPTVPIERQIDVLLRRRLKPEPLPLDLPNPFVMTNKSRRDSVISQTTKGPEPAAASAAPVEEPKPITTAQVLADCVARLRFGGVIRMKDQIQIVINDAPRKEGDTITMIWNGAQIQLRLLHIAPDQIVLRYLSSELVVKL